MDEVCCWPETLGMEAEAVVNLRVSPADVSLLAEFSKTLFRSETSRRICSIDRGIEADGNDL